MTAATKPKASLSQAASVGLLLAELIAALSFGAWTGWQQTPYDSLIGLAGLLFCAALTIIALVRAISNARAGEGKAASRWGPFLAVILVQPFALLALASASHAFDERGKNALFQANRHRFECLVSHAVRRTWSKGRHVLEACGTTAAVYVADQMRVELDSAGYFSNWEVIVYDPSESLRLIESRSVNLGPPNLRRALGEFSITYCRRLSGKYFFCRLG